MGVPAALIAMRVLRAQPAQLAHTAGRLRPQRGDLLYAAVAAGLLFAAWGYVLGREADRLRELSGSDPLTGLLNLRSLQSRLSEEIQRAVRYGHPLSVLIVDLDYLKEINDRHGHLVGDRALLAVAEAIRRELRTPDIAGRWGGDEFVILAPDTSDAAARQLADRVRRLVASTAIDAGAGPRLTASIGITTLDALDEGTVVSPRALIHAADQALYEAKMAGRDRVRVGGCLEPH